jgi:hypothetical protein
MIAFTLGGTVLEKRKDSELPKSVEKFARGLLTTTCLTAACGATAAAGTITLPETDFPNSAPGVLLATGTTVVNSFIGNLPFEGGPSSPEWFEFQGLTPGDTFDLTAAYNPLGPREGSGNGETGVRVSVFNSSLTPLFTDQSIENGGLTGANMLVGIVPVDGLVDVEVFNQFTETALVPRTRPLNVEGVSQGFGSAYQVTLADVPNNSVPEPGTATAMGLGLAGAGALAWRRKRSQ